MTDGARRLSSNPLPGAAAHPLRDAPDACFRFPRLSLVCLQSCLSHNRQATLGDIFLAIDRPDMRGVSIAIGASDPKLLLVRIDPLPQLYADGESLQTGLALDAHEIDGKPVAVAAAAAQTAAVSPSPASPRSATVQAAPLAHDSLIVGLQLLHARQESCARSFCMGLILGFR